MCHWWFKLFCNLTCWCKIYSNTFSSNKNGPKIHQFSFAHLDMHVWFNLRYNYLYNFVLVKKLIHWNNQWQHINIKMTSFQKTLIKMFNLYISYSANIYILKYKIHSIKVRISFVSFINKWTVDMLFIIFNLGISINHVNRSFLFWKWMKKCWATNYFK